MYVLTEVLETQRYGSEKRLTSFKKNLPHELGFSPIVPFTTVLVPFPAVMLRVFNENN